MTTLLHFTATGADAVCVPHRRAVAAAADALGGWTVWEVDIDAAPETAHAYAVLNVPAVTVEGRLGEAPLVGAQSTEALVRRFRSSG